MFDSYPRKFWMVANAHGAMGPIKSLLLQCSEEAYSALMTLVDRAPEKICARAWTAQTNSTSRASNGAVHYSGFDDVSRSRTRKLCARAWTARTSSDNPCSNWRSPTAVPNSKIRAQMGKYALRVNVPSCVCSRKHPFLFVPMLSSIGSGPC
jgi:hypothetical protein